MSGQVFTCNACGASTPYYKRAQEHAYTERHPRIRIEPKAGK